jgi:two-component system, OmpR family, sensor histidine kinase CssS
MKRNTIKWKIFKYNIIVIILLVALTTIIFNVAIRVYIEKDILSQLSKISSNIEHTALQHGPDFYPAPETAPYSKKTPIQTIEVTSDAYSKSGTFDVSTTVSSTDAANKIENTPTSTSTTDLIPVPNSKNTITIGSNTYTVPKAIPQNNPKDIPTSNPANSGTISNPGAAPPAMPSSQKEDAIFRYYFMLDRTLKDSLTVLNSDYLLLDKNRNILNPFSEKFSTTSADMLHQIISKIDEQNNSAKSNSDIFLDFKLSNTEYISIIKPVFNKNSFGLGWIVIYSSLEKVNQLQTVINIILFSILIFSALIIGVFSSHISKRISSPFIYLSKYIKEIAARNFGAKIIMQVDEELKEFVENINIMSEKLETYDKAQKTFLQNASHEFRTPLMSIKSYAEGIKYQVVDSEMAVDVIIDETNRMTRLVEDLLYLSRLDTIEENYHFMSLDFDELINICVSRMNVLANKNNITITTNPLNANTNVYVDEEKFSRAIINIISNCIRYASSCILITSTLEDTIIRLEISDDGPGFEPNELPIIFDRFYKGKKGNFGLGLSISKNVIKKHKGEIQAENTDKGALFIIELPIYRISDN